MRRPPAVRLGTLAALALAASCGGDKTSPPPVSSAAPTASAPPPVVSIAPPSPFSVVLESSSPLTFSGMTGGVWVGHWPRLLAAQAADGKDLVGGPMPEGLPDRPGRVLRVSGRLPGSMWLTFQEEDENGKPGATPLFRLTRGAWKRIADNWEPLLATWSKNRLLAASTSSGRLKIKVMEPQTAQPPADMPGARLDDETCAKSLKLRQLAALPSGEVLGAGNCTPDGQKGARYVVIRWVPPGAEAGADAGADAAAGAGAAADAGADAGTGAATDTGADTAADAGADAGAGAAPEAAAEGVPGTVLVIPGATGNLSHRALYARSATEVYAAAVDEKQKAGHLARFDGAAWSVEPLPPEAEPLRALSGTGDGTLWMITEHQIWKRAASGAWEQVPPPNRAFPEPDPAWELQDVWAGGGEDVWIAARHTSKAGARHLVLRSRPAAAPLRWP